MSGCDCNFIGLNMWCFSSSVQVLQTTFRIPTTTASNTLSFGMFHAPCIIIYEYIKQKQIKTTTETMSQHLNYLRSNDRLLLMTVLNQMTLSSHPCPSERALSQIRMIGDLKGPGTRERENQMDGPCHWR